MTQHLPPPPRKNFAQPPPYTPPLEPLTLASPAIKQNSRSKHSLFHSLQKKSQSIEISMSWSLQWLRLRQKHAIQSMMTLIWSVAVPLYPVGSHLQPRESTLILFIVNQTTGLQRQPISPMKTY